MEKKTIKQLIESNERRGRILAFLNSLSLAPKRTCKSLHYCELCACEIRNGQEYRDRGVDRRAHEECFQACAKEFRK